MIDYQLRKSRRAKHLRLRVYGDGRVVVSAPTWLGSRVIEDFVVEKIDWLRGKLDLVKRTQPRVSCKRSREEYLKRKDEALSLVEERIAHYNAIYGFRVNRVSIRNQKTRWGSCSTQGNLSFNYRIVKLLPEERDYVIVHELCHLREMNHSSQFWTLVEKTVPEYRRLRQAMRKRARTLF